MTESPGRIRLYADLLRQTSLGQQLRRLRREVDRRLLPGLRSRWRPAVDDRSRLYGRLAGVEGFETACERARAGRPDEARAELATALERRASRVWPFDPDFWNRAFEWLPSARPTFAGLVVRDAERALGRIFEADGGPAVPLGDVVDWNPPGIDDRERVYTLNRLNQLPLLAVACRLTGDRRYATEIRDLLLQWVAANPRTGGRPWDTLTTSLRMNHVLLAWGLLRGTGFLDPAADEAVLLVLLGHADFVVRHLELDLLNNHLLFEARALLGASCLLPGAPFGRRWRTTGLANLAREAGHQVWPDGTHGEQSAGYHFHMLHELLAALRILRSAHELPPPGLEDALRRMTAHAADLVRPDGSLPMTGDTLRRDPQGPAPEEMLPAAEALLGLPPLQQGGGDGLRGFLLLGPDLPAEDGRPFRSLARGSRVYADGGACILRHAGRDLQLHFDAGPFAMSDNVAHGHADALQIELSATGRPLIADSGAFTYAKGPWRAWFRGTSAHSTITVDGLDQVHLWGSFRAYRPRGARLLGHSTDGDLQWADAVHEHSASRTRHRRRVVLLPEGAVLLVDDLDVDRPRLACSRLHFVPGSARLDAAAGRCRFAEREGSGRLDTLCDLGPDDGLSVVEGREDPPQGWISYDFGVRHAAPVLEWTRPVAARSRFVCLLDPGAGTGGSGVTCVGDEIEVRLDGGVRLLELLEVGVK